MSDDVLPATAEAGSAADAPAAGAPATARRLALTASMARLGRLLVTIALLVLGGAIGVMAFQAREAPGTAPAAGDPATAGIAAPAVVLELADAMAANDTDRIRAAVPGDPYGLLTKEMGNWSFGEVTGVDALATYQDEGRTATELVVHGRTSSGSPLLINLIVHVEGGVIVNFR